MSESPHRPCVFLSHTSENKAFARRLGHDLQEHDVRVWLDKWEIRVGESLRRKIERGITESGFLAVILSPAAIRSEWVQVELSAAMARELRTCRVFVLPVLLEDCEIPPFLQDKKYADFRTDYVNGLEELLTVILPEGESSAPFGQIIDVNAHLWMTHFEEDLPAVIHRARQGGVQTLMASGCNGPYSWSRCLEIAGRYPTVYVSLALHPVRGSMQRPDSPTDEELALLEKFVIAPKVVAVGDVQLQYTLTEDVSQARQLHILEHQLAVALRHRLPIIVEVHGGGEPGKDFLNLMDHGYQDNLSVAVQDPQPMGFALECRDRGYYLVVDGLYTLPRADPLKQLLEVFPSSRLLLASDCPALAPPPFRGRRNEPAFIAQLLEELRGACPYSPSELARVSTENAMRLFRLDQQRYPPPPEGTGLKQVFG